MGAQYDATGPGVLPHIQSFVKAYAIPLDQLLEQDLTKYPVSFPSHLARTAISAPRSIGLQDHLIHLPPPFIQGSPVPSSDTQTFNSFFARHLLPTARPVACRDDPHVLVCPADCRLSVFQTIDAAKALW